MSVVPQRVASALLMFSANIKPSKAYAAGLAEVRQGAIGNFARPGPRSARGAFRRPKGAYSMRGPVHGPTPGSEPIYAADTRSVSPRAPMTRRPHSPTCPQRCPTTLSRRCEIYCRDG